MGERNATSLQRTGYVVITVGSQTESGRASASADRARATQTGMSEPGLKTQKVTTVKRES